MLAAQRTARLCQMARGRATEHDYELAWADARHASREWLKR